MNNSHLTQLFVVDEQQSSCELLFFSTDKHRERLEEQLQGVLPHLHTHKHQTTASVSMYKTTKMFCKAPQQKYYINEQETFHIVTSMKIQSTRLINVQAQSTSETLLQKKTITAMIIFVHNEQDSDLPIRPHT